MSDNLQTSARRAPTHQSDIATTASVALKGRREHGGSLSHLIGESAVMQQLRRQLREFSSRSTNVMIYGEPGTGKGLVARALHQLSDRRDGAIVVVDCSGGWDAVAETLGGLAALTGHGERRPVTLILRGVQELSTAAQSEVAQNLANSSNGHADRNPHLSLRVIAIVDANPQAAIAQGLLHPDVQQRLAPASLAVPTLRQREDDVELLAQYFLALLNSEADTAKRFAGESLVLMRKYGWPGNVRELRAAVQRAFVSSDSDLHLNVDAPARLATPSEVRALRIPVGTCLADAERWMIAATLHKCGGNKTRAAALLGVSLKTLYNRLNAYRAEGLELSSVDRELAEVAV